MLEKVKAAVKSETAKRIAREIAVNAAIGLGTVVVVSVVRTGATRVYEAISNNSAENETLAE